MNKDLATRPRELLDSQEIHDRLVRYLRDRSDAELIQDNFYPDAPVDHGHSKFKGEGIGKLFAGTSRHTTAHHVHFLTNVPIEVRGEEAFSETYCLYNAETMRNSVPYMLQRPVRDMGRWARRNGERRIFHRRVAGR